MDRVLVRRRGGYSLIEMATVVAVLALLSAAGFFTYSHLSDRASEQASQTELGNWAQSAAADQDFTESMRVRLTASSVHGVLPSALFFADGCEAPGQGACASADRAGQAGYALASDGSAAQLVVRAETGRCVELEVEGTSPTDTRVRSDVGGDCTAFAPPASGQPGFGGPVEDGEDGGVSWSEPEQQFP